MPKSAKRTPGKLVVRRMAGAMPTTAEHHRQSPSADGGGSSKLPMLDGDRSFGVPDLLDDAFALPCLWQSN